MFAAVAILASSAILAAVAILASSVDGVTSSPGVLRFYNLKSQFQAQLAEGLWCSHLPYLSHSSCLCVHGDKSYCLTQLAGEEEARCSKSLKKEKQAVKASCSC